MHFWGAPSRPNKPPLKYWEQHQHLHQTPTGVDSESPTAAERMLPNGRMLPASPFLPKTVLLRSIQRP